MRTLQAEAHARRVRLLQAAVEVGALFVHLYAPTSLTPPMPRSPSGDETRRPSCGVT